jgi:uncharacterized membrane protein
MQPTGGCEHFLISLLNQPKRILMAATPNIASDQAGRGPDSHRPNGPPLTKPANGADQVNVGPTERVISLAGGTLLTILGVRRFSLVGGIALSLAGGALLYRGATGYCPVNETMGRNTARSQPKGLQLVQSVTINKPRQEVYDFWRQLENLARFMNYQAEVRSIDEKRSHWKANVPGGLGTLEWEAEITRQEPGAWLAWQSLPGAAVNNAGEVRFQDAPGNRGTEVHATISYLPPAGGLGRAAAGLLNDTSSNWSKRTCAGSSV